MLYISFIGFILIIIAINNEAHENDKLVNKENVVTITLTEADITATYTINVFKGNRDLINNITIDGYEFIFDKTIFNYDLKINNNDSELKIQTSHIDGANIQILGNDNLQNGSVIMLIASYNGTNQTYTINIIKEKVDMTLYYYLGGGFGIFMFIVYFIVRHYKVKNGELPDVLGKFKNKLKLKIKQSKEAKPQKKKKLKIKSEEVENDEKKLEAKKEKQKEIETKAKEEKKENENSKKVEESIETLDL